MYSKMYILVIWNIHESYVSMNGKIKCVKNQSKKWWMYAYEVQIYYYNWVEWFANN